MKAQAAIEGMIMMLFLMMGLSLMFSQIYWKKDQLNEEENLQYVKQACNRIKLGIVHALFENNTIITLNFEKGFNITAYPDERGFFIQKDNEEYLCSIFTNKFSNNTVIQDFNASILTNLTIQGYNNLLVMS